MHAKPDLRVVLEWMVTGSGSVIAAVIWLVNHTQMFGLSWMLIVMTLAVILAAGVLLFTYALNAFLKLGLGQAGESSQWHMTVEHDRSKSFPPRDYWTTAINYIEEIGGKLNRSWNSHGSTGDRLNREYNLDDQKILLEYDRWNGFTISGKTDVAKPLAESIENLVENAR